MIFDKNKQEILKKKYGLAKRVVHQAQLVFEFFPLSSTVDFFLKREDGNITIRLKTQLSQLNHLREFRASVDFQLLLVNMHMHMARAITPLLQLRYRMPWTHTQAVVSS